MLPLYFNYTLNTGRGHSVFIYQHRHETAPRPTPSTFPGSSLSRHAMILASPSAGRVSVTSFPAPPPHGAVCSLFPRVNPHASNSLCSTRHLPMLVSRRCKQLDKPGASQALRCLAAVFEEGKPQCGVQCFHIERPGPGPWFISLLGSNPRHRSCVKFLTSLG